MVFKICEIIFREDKVKAAVDKEKVVAEDK